MKSLESVSLTAVFEPAAEGGFTCSFEELPEVFSEGETLEEAEANLFDALKLVLEYHREEARKQTRPPGARRHPFQIAPA
jgi:predicted RNase H-like HicB family nuclease